MRNQAIKIIEYKKTKTDNSEPFRLNGGVWWIPDSFLIKNKIDIGKSKIVKRDNLLLGTWIQENNIPEYVSQKIQKYRTGAEDE